MSIVASRGFRVCAAATAIACLCGCGPRRTDPTVPIQAPGRTAVRVRLTQSGQLIRIREGHLLAVHLPGDEDAGTWKMVKKPDARVLRPLRHGRGASGGRGRDAIVKSDVIFYFAAQRPGITSFAIKRPGTGESPSLERFELAVDVYY